MHMCCCRVGSTSAARQPVASHLHRSHTRTHTQNDTTTQQQGACAQHNTELACDLCETEPPSFDEHKFPHVPHARSACADVCINWRGISRAGGCRVTAGDVPPMATTVPQARCDRMCSPDLTSRTTRRVIYSPPIWPRRRLCVCARTKPANGKSFWSRVRCTVVSIYEKAFECALARTHIHS